MHLIGYALASVISFSFYVALGDVEVDWTQIELDKEWWGTVTLMLMIGVAWLLLAWR